MEATEELIRPERLCAVSYPFIRFADSPQATPSLTICPLGILSPVKGGSWRGEQFAESTLPCFLRLYESSVAGAGRGVFSRIDLQPGTVFGPYMVHYRPLSGGLGYFQKDGDFKGSILEGGNFTEEELRYAWQVRAHCPEDERLKWPPFELSTAEELAEDIHRYVSGANASNSNWLRFVNAARCKSPAPLPGPD